MLIWLKYGAPTLTWTPRKASATSGYVVPSSTVKVKATNRRLFSMNAVSRDARESSVGSPPRSSLRQATSASETMRTRAMKPRKKGPISPWVKA